MIWLPMILVAVTLYGVVASFVWTVERDAAYRPDLAERQAILGRAIWWLPCLAYWAIKSLILLVVRMLVGFYNATYQMLLSEFEK